MKYRHAPSEWKRAPHPSGSIAAARHNGGVARASRLRERAHPPLHLCTLHRNGSVHHTVPRVLSNTLDKSTRAVARASRLRERAHILIPRHAPSEWKRAPHRCGFTNLEGRAPSRPCLWFSQLDPAVPGSLPPITKPTRGVARASRLRERAHLPYTSARSIGMEARTTP